MAGVGDGAQELLEVRVAQLGEGRYGVQGFGAGADEAGLHGEMEPGCGLAVVRGGWTRGLEVDLGGV